MTVDALAITRQLVDAGFGRAQAEVVAHVLRGANSDLATRADIERAVAPLATRASLYRALWLQTGAIVAAVAGILVIVSGIS